MNKQSSASPYDFDGRLSQTESRQALLMDYLYGELPPNEHVAFREWLKDHAELKHEIHQLRKGKDILDLDASRTNTEADPFLLPSFYQKPRSFRNWPKLALPLLKYAAIFAFIFLGAQLMNVQLEWQEQSLTLHFGEKSRLDKEQQLRENIRNEVIEIMPELTAIMQSSLRQELDKALIAQRSEYQDIILNAVGEQQLMYENLLIGALNELQKQRRDDLFTLQQELLQTQDQQLVEIARNREGLNNLIQLATEPASQLRAE